MTDLADEVVETLGQHTIRAGIMASPNHWAYHHPEGQWFAHCSSDSRVGEVGCGWDSKPHCFLTREEARRVGNEHVAEELRKKFRMVWEPVDD